jgi:hypothetical protein
MKEATPMFCKINPRAVIATSTVLAAIAAASTAGPASADTTPAPTVVTQPAPNQANKTWDNLTGTGSYFWWNVKQDVYMGYIKAA